MIASILDTNAYIKLVSKRNFDEVRSFVHEIKEAESRCGYIAYIYPTVAQELLSHLLDKQPICNPQYTYTKACMAIYDHCSDKELNQYRMSPFHELQIAHAYWGIDNKIVLETQKSICYILSEIEKNPNCRTIIKYRKQIEQIKKFTQEAEQEYIAGIAEIKQKILQQNSQYKDWNEFLSDKKNRDAVSGYVKSPGLREFLATAMIYAIAIDLHNKGYALPNKQSIDNAVKIYMQDCKASIELQMELFSHWDDPNFDFGRPDRVNTIWDLKVLSCAGHKLSNQDEILLVTDDKKMIRAAKDAIPNCKIFTYSEYMETIGVRI